MLREFGQRKIQPVLMKIAVDEKMRKAVKRLMPLVTVQDCNQCPALEHCLNACIGFRNLYERCKNE